MAVTFDGINQHLSIAAPRPELNGLTSYMATFWFMPPPGATAAPTGYAFSFSSGAAADENRAGWTHFRFIPGSDLCVGRVRRTDGGIEQQTVVTPGGSVAPWFIMTGMYANPPFSQDYAATDYLSRTPPILGVGVGAGGGGGVVGPFPATSSLAAAIGALSDGLSRYFQGQIEDLRIWNQWVGSPPGTGSGSVLFWKLALMRGADVRSFMDPRLLLQWRLRGHGTVTTEVDRKAGVVATAVSGPQYSRMNATRYRRRNRGG